MEEFKKNIKWRINLVYIGILLVALAIVVRTAVLIFFEGDKWRGRTENQTTRNVDVEAKRGNIYSSDGSILVMTMPIFTVRMDLHHSVVPQDTFNLYVRALSDSLTKLFPKKSSNEWQKLLTEARSKDLGVNQDTKISRGRGARDFLIARNIRYAELKRLQMFPILNKGKNRGGLVVEETNRRIRMHNQLAERTIGYYNVESGVGVGLEGAYNDVLKGHSGKRVERKVANGVWRPVFNNQQEPENGKDIVTTIDMRVQDVAHDALRRNLQRANASHGTAILMEVSTGKIRAIVNLKFNEKDGTYHEVENFAVNESVEPGSTFKLASLIAILEEGKLDTGSLVPTGKMQVGNRRLRDTREEGYGEISLKHAFELSSNVGLAYAARQSFSKNEKKFTDYFHKMRLNRPLGLEIAGERNPVIKTMDEKKKDDTWWVGSLEWTSMGYEVQLTPLQQLSFYNAVANNGRLMKPMFVEEIRSGGQIVKRFEPTVLESRIASEKTIKKVKGCLEGVVQNGTAKSLAKSPYKIAGKTGTAQINYNERGVERTRHRASFIGYFPADNPKYTCLVIVSNPSGIRVHGGEIAAPVFKEIADKVYATHLNMEMELPDLEDFQPLKLVANTDKLDEMKSSARSSKQIPSVRGMTARDAVYVLESLGYKVMLNGRGIVREQSIDAGTAIILGQQIWLRLS
ncbi:MAG: transpeptidase family protein [Bacteroidales bacterium]|jgi:cell division protein FtsI (penicillin-binding protein 3)|nr:transpeptidase family protein [Bacteroidales bacterium]